MSRFVPACQPPATPTAIQYHFIFVGHHLLLYRAPQQAEAGWSIPSAAISSNLILPLHSQHYLGQFDGHDCYALALQEKPTVDDVWCWQTLRQASLLLEYAWFTAASTAFQILYWDSTHQFCGRCGKPLQQAETERTKRCLTCKLNHYPRIAPAVIMLIYRDDEVLLSRSPRFEPGVYSVQAGFVEAGETLEETVEREVMEEVGLKVKNIRYFGSQSWPFPNSLMLGFTAEYAGGELCIDHDELEDANWYRKDALPRLPHRVSIAHRLIDWFLVRNDENVPKIELKS